MFDKIGDGSASYSWTIEGKREDGTPWELHKTNMYVSEFDLSFESAFEIYGELLAIANYPNEDIELTNTEATIDLEETVRDYHIERLLWCHGGTCEKVRSLKAFPGDTLKFRAILKPSDGLGEPEGHLPVQDPEQREERRGGDRRRRLGLQPVLRRVRPDAGHVRRPARELRGQAEQRARRPAPHGPEGRPSAPARTSPSTQAITGFAQVSIIFPGQCCPPFAGGGEEGGFFFFKNAS